MRNEAFEKTAPLIEPLYDTWGWKQETGCWCITSVVDLSCVSLKEFNAWFAMSIIKTLDAFSQLARPWQIFFNTLHSEDIKGVNLEWKLGDSYEDYIENALKSIREYPFPIYELDMQVDLFVYVRTQEFPKQPVRGWIRLPHNEIFIVGEVEGKKPYLCFDTSYTLFRPLSRDYEDNSELYSLNQPLLENALRLWEDHFGAISDVDGIEGIYEYGFLTEI